MLSHHTHSHPVAVSAHVMRQGFARMTLFIPQIVMIMVVTLLMVVPSLFVYHSHNNGVDGFMMTKGPTSRTTPIRSLPTNPVPTAIDFLKVHPRRHYSTVSSTLSSSLLVEDNSTVALATTGTTVTTEAGISMSDAVFGIVKAMVGSGLLALSSGLAMVTNIPSHLYMAHVLLIGMSIISAYTFILYGKLVHATQAQTLGELWKMIYNDSSNETSTSSASSFRLSDLTVSMATFIFCFGSCIAYSLTFGDMCSNFVRGMVGFCTTGSSGDPTTGSAAPLVLLSNVLQSRQASILLITGSVILPLCRLPSLAALAPMSMLGVIGTLVTIAFLGYRCPSIVATSPYGFSNVGVAGTMLSNILQQPSFSTYSRIRSPAPLIFIAMACVSYMAHFSAPDFYHSFVGRNTATTTTKSTNNETIPTRPIKRYNQMTITGYTIVTLLNICALTFSFLTFGGGCNGIILNNYNNIDAGAIVSRLLVGISVIGSYPFVMNSCRNAAIEIWNTLTQANTRLLSTSSATVANTFQKERRMTNILLGVITSIALLTKDTGFVIGFNGAVMGSTIAFTFPALLFLKFHQKCLASTTTAPSGPTTVSETSTSTSKFDVWACRGLIVFGVVSSIVGGVTTIISSFAPHLLS